MRKGKLTKDERSWVKSMHLWLDVKRHLIEDAEESFVLYKRAAYRANRMACLEQAQVKLHKQDLRRAENQLLKWAREHGCENVVLRRKKGGV